MNKPLKIMGNVLPMTLFCFVGFLPHQAAAGLVASPSQPSVPMAFNTPTPPLMVGLTNVKTLRVAAPLFFGLMLQSNPSSQRSAIPAGNNITSGYDLILNTSTMALTRLSTFSKTTFNPDGSGGYIPAQPDPIYRRVVRHPDATWEVDFLGHGTRDFLQLYSNGLLKTIVHDNVPIKSFNYDSLNRLLQWSDPDQNTMTLGYGLNGLVATVNYAEKVFTFSYDSAGDLISINGPSGVALVTITYLSPGVPSSIGYFQGITSKFTYDSNNNVATETQTDPLGNTTINSYSFSGNTINLVVNNNIDSPTVIQLDSLGRIIQRTGASFTYTNSFQLPASSTASQMSGTTLVTSSVAYTRSGPGGRPTQISTNGVLTGTYSYNAFGQLLNSIEGSNSVTRTFNTAGQELSSTLNGLTGLSSYDAVTGFLTGYVTPQNSYQYTYDDKGKVTSVTTYTNGSSNGTTQYFYASGPMGFSGFPSGKLDTSGNTSSSVWKQNACGAFQVSNSTTDSNRNLLLSGCAQYGLNWLPENPYISDGEPLFAFPGADSEIPLISLGAIESSTDCAATCSP